MNYPQNELNAFAELTARSFGLEPNPTISIAPDMQREFNRRNGVDRETGVIENNRPLLPPPVGVVAAIEKTVHEGAPGIAYTNPSGRVTAYSFPDIAARDAAYVRLVTALRAVAGR